MTNKTEFSGEAREKRRNRLQWAIIIVSLALGLGIGGGIAMSIDGNFLTSDEDWPPILAIGVIVCSLIVVPALMLFALRTTDEMELASQAWGMQAGGFALICAYPAWFAAWKGGFVEEPSHTVIFIGYFVVATAAYAVHRFR